MTKGEGLAKIVTVLKVKNGVATKIEMDGYEYTLIHENQWSGRKKNAK